MKTGCLINLIIYLAVVYGYYLWFEPTVDSPEIWYMAFGIGLLSYGGLAALYNAWLAARDAAVLRHLHHDAGVRSEGWTAVAGTLEAYDQLLVAPLSGKRCVMVEYELATVGPELDTDDKKVDFAGIAMAACGIKSDFDKLQLFGFPDLENVPLRYCARASDRIRAWQYVRNTDWKDCSGQKMFAGVGSMWNALTEAADSFKHDWRIASDQQCDWLLNEEWVVNDLERLNAEQLELDDEHSNDPDEPDRLEEHHVDDDDDLEDDDHEDDFVNDRDSNDDSSFDDLSYDGPGPRRSQYHPRMTEKRLFAGDPVVAIGHYDPLRGGLVSAVSESGLRVRLYRGEAATVLRKLRGSMMRRFFGGLAWLLAVNGFVVFAMWAYHNNPVTEEGRQKKFEQAIEHGDLSTAKQMLSRGVAVDHRTDSRGQTLLMKAEHPEISKLLIDNGANINAEDIDGNTPLMFAARRGDMEKIKLLLTAGAKLETRNTCYGTTALEDALNSDNGACAELLRQAGAIDQTVTAANGQSITSEHPAFVTCREYMKAIHAADPVRLRELNSAQRPATFDDVDWELWRNTRPREPELIAGFVNDGDATIKLTGIAANGSHKTWVLQLRLEAGEWRVKQERWLIGQ